MHETGAGGDEAAGPLVERHHVLSVVDEQPLAARSADRFLRVADDRGPEALALTGRMRLRVDEERVVRAVPRDVDEPDQNPVLGPGPRPSRASAGGPDPTKTGSGAPPCAAVRSTISSSPMCERQVRVTSSWCIVPSFHDGVVCATASSRTGVRTTAARSDVRGSGRGGNEGVASGRAGSRGTRSAGVARHARSFGAQLDVDRIDRQRLQSLVDRTAGTGTTRPLGPDDDDDAVLRLDAQTAHDYPGGVATQHTPLDHRTATPTTSRPAFGTVTPDGELVAMTFVDTDGPHAETDFTVVHPGLRARARTGGQGCVGARVGGHGHDPVPHRRIGGEHRDRGGERRPRLRPRRGVGDARAAPAGGDVRTAGREARVGPAPRLPSVRPAAG